MIGGGQHIDGFEVPIHGSLGSPLLLGGAPRGLAIVNGTLAAAVGLGLQQWVTVQAQVVENIQSDTQALADIVARSQGAEGSLQAQQATNQLLALTAKQQFQLQHMMAAQFRSEAVEQARRATQAAEAFRYSGSASLVRRSHPGSSPAHRNSAPERHSAQRSARPV